MLRVTENNWLPTDYSDALVFSQEGIGRLQQTIEGLQEEKARQRQVFKEIRATQVRGLWSRPCLPCTQMFFVLYLLICLVFRFSLSSRVWFGLVEF